MPELPEVESARKKCNRMLLNKRITQATVATDAIVFENVSAQKVKKALDGHTVKKTGRKGKYFWLELYPKSFLLMHLGMTGKVREINKKTTDSPRSLKLKVMTQSGSGISISDGRRFARIRLVSDIKNDKTIQRLGWDVLNEKIPFAEVQKKFAKRTIAIKSLLLDQTIFAGVENWIADEVLYQAKLAPSRPASSLTSVEIKRLFAQIRKVITTAVKADADYKKFPKDWLFHQRWGKKKDAVTGRKEKIVHVTIGGRTTAWVPAVQK